MSPCPISGTNQVEPLFWDHGLQYSSYYRRYVRMGVFAECVKSFQAWENMKKLKRAAVTDNWNGSRRDGLLKGFFGLKMWLKNHLTTTVTETSL